MSTRGGDNNGGGSAPETVMWSRPRKGRRRTRAHVDYVEMSVRYGSIKLQVPRGFKSLLEHLAREILREQPKDIPEFAAAYFKRLLQRREEGYTDPFLVSERIVESSPQAEEESAPPAAEENVSAVESPVEEAQAPLEAEPVKPQEEEEEMPDLEDPDVKKAAAVIQASFRGFKTRKDSSGTSSNKFKTKNSAAAGTSAKARKDDEARKQLAKEELIEQLIVTGEELSMGSSLNRESSACIVQSEYEVCPRAAVEEQAAVPEVIEPIESMQVEAMAPVTEQVNAEEIIWEVKDSQEWEESPPVNMYTVTEPYETHAETCQSIVCTFEKDEQGIESEGSPQQEEKLSFPEDEFVVAQEEITLNRESSACIVQSEYEVCPEVQEEIVAAVEIKTVHELPPEIVMIEAPEDVAEEYPLAQAAEDRDEGIECDEQADLTPEVKEQSIEASQLPCDEGSAPTAVEVIEETVACQEAAIESFPAAAQIEDETEVLPKEEVFPGKAEEDIYSSTVEEKTLEKEETEPAAVVGVEIVIEAAEMPSEASLEIPEEVEQEVVESQPEPTIGQEEDTKQEPQDVHKEHPEEPIHPAQQSQVAEESVEAVIVEVTEEALPPNVMIETSEPTQDATETVQEEEIAQAEGIESAPFQDAHPADESLETEVGDSTGSPEVQEIIVDGIVEVQEACIQESAPEPLEQESTAGVGDSTGFPEVQEIIVDEVVKVQEACIQESAPEPPEQESRAPAHEAPSTGIYDKYQQFLREQYSKRDSGKQEEVAAEEPPAEKAEEPAEAGAPTETQEAPATEETQVAEQPEQAEASAETQPPAAEEAPGAEEVEVKKEEVEEKKEEAAVEVEETKEVAAEEVEGKKEEAAAEVEETKEVAAEEVVGKTEEAAEEVEVVENKEEAAAEVEEMKEVAAEEVEAKKEEAAEEVVKNKEEIPAEDSQAQVVAEDKPEEPAAAEEPASATEEIEEQTAAGETGEPATEQAPQEAPKEEVPAAEEAPAAEQPQEPAAEEAPAQEAAAPESEDTQAEDKLKVETAELTEIEAEPAKEEVETTDATPAESAVVENEKEETKEEPAAADQPAEDKPAADQPAEDKPAADQPAEDKPAAE